MPARHQLLLLPSQEAFQHRSPAPSQQDRRTEAEKRYAEKARKAEERIVQRMAEKGNREKIQEFNQYLSVRLPRGPHTASTNDPDVASTC